MQYTSIKFSQNTSESMIAKPFLKWVGGKNQLLKEISQYYPFNSHSITKYAEPFVGGGAVLFDILNRYNLEQVYISDTNPQLINTYCVVRDHVDDLICLLKEYQNIYTSLNQEQRKEYYLMQRERFNLIKQKITKINTIEQAALMIFLNKTCFNGLYRVNKKGQFNVPAGSYKNPLICDEKNLSSVSKKLKSVQIVWGDYKQSMDFVDQNTFVYFDPPYRPLNATASFTAYTEQIFQDKSQIELAEYIHLLSKKGAKILLSNSDPKNIDEMDTFFDDLYIGYTIKRVNATRMINCKGKNRGMVKELLICNFQERI